MAFTHGETVTRLRGTHEWDPYSQTYTAIDWTDPDPLDIDGCVVYPSSTGETVDVGRRQLEERLTVLMPHGSDVTAADKLTIRGHDYDIDGAPHDYHHPVTGWEPGTALTAVRRLG